MTTSTDTGGHIVVGVDGSEGAQRALRWAIRQAELTGAALTVVMVWSVPLSAFTGPIPISSTDIAPPDTAGMQRANEQALENLVSDALGVSAAVVATIVVEGHPAAELLVAAETADLLVVGRRGHHPFTGTRLGSVSARCVAHAGCPVVVVPSAKAGE